MGELANSLGRFCGGVTFAFALVISVSASAEPKITERVTYYDISGPSPRDLVAQMRALGPLDNLDQRTHRFARSDWHVSWHYGDWRTPNQCAISKVLVTLDIVSIYPRWTREAQADTAMRKEWQDFMAGVFAHESGHGRNGIDTAREIEQTVAAISPEANCADLGAKVDAVVSAIIQKHNAIDIEYDRITDHGRTQGAYLTYPGSLLATP